MQVTSDPVCIFTCQCQNEGDPHEKVESPKDVVARLFPILTRRRADDVLPILGPALSS